MKEKIVYKFDSFIDYEGKEHKIVMAAVSRPVDTVYFTEDTTNV